MPLPLGFEATQASMPLPVPVNVQPVLCRRLDYADHWVRTRSGGGDR
jgi:hypothetical protein